MATIIRSDKVLRIVKSCPPQPSAISLAPHWGGDVAGGADWLLLLETIANSSQDAIKPFSAIDGERKGIMNELKSGLESSETDNEHVSCPNVG